MVPLACFFEKSKCLTFMIAVRPGFTTSLSYIFISISYEINTNSILLAECIRNRSIVVFCCGWQTTPFGIQMSICFFQFFECIVNCIHATSYPFTNYRSEHPFLRRITICARRASDSDDFRTIFTGFPNT